jgi:hypothetical protein
MLLKEAKKMFEDLREFSKKLGLPPGDLYELPTSGQTFPDGAHFRIEVPTVNSPDGLKGVLEQADKHGITINRVDETWGIFRYTTAQIKEFLKVAKDAKVELNFSHGPRATYDTSATVLTPQGVVMSYRLRGMEQVYRAVEDIRRVLDLGGRGFLIYDEGLLWFLNELRKEGKLPKSIKFKLSAHCGHCNPFSFRLLESLGADTINPVRDLTLPMIAALRRAVKIPLDVHSDNPPGSGGFIRTYEGPEMVRIASPIHLKTGNSRVGAHGIPTSAQDGRNMADQASIVVETMKRYFPEAKQSKAGTPDMSIPL